MLLFIQFYTKFMNVYIMFHNAYMCYYAYNSTKGELKK